jgi:hypothetical protein
VRTAQGLSLPLTVSCLILLRSPWHFSTNSHMLTLPLAQCPAPGGCCRSLQAVVDAISSFGESLASGPGQVPESYTLFGTRPAGRKLLGGRARD